MARSTTLSVRGCPQPQDKNQDGNRTFLRGRRKNYILVVIISAVIISIFLVTFYEQQLTAGRTRLKLEDIRYVPSHLLSIGNDTVKYNCLKNAFSNVAMVVTFNFQFYKNIPILKKLYKDVFGVVAFCGAPVPEKDKLDADSKPDIIVDVGGGYFGYICMAKLIEKYPSYQGYLYVNDDMLVNWWTLLARDGSKVWQGAEIVDFRQDAYGPIVNKNWQWWRTDMGIKACQEAYKELTALAKTKNVQFDAKKALDTYLRNGDGKPRCGKGWSDFFYVPGSVSRTCRHLLELNYKHKVFLEISVNNVLRSLDDAKNFENLKGMYLPDADPRAWDSNEGRPVWEQYSTKLTFLHPIKMGSGPYAKMNQAIVTQWILDITKSLTKC